MSITHTLDATGATHPQGTLQQPQTSATRSSGEQSQISVPTIVVVDASSSNSPELEDVFSPPTPSRRPLHKKRAVSYDFDSRSTDIKLSPPGASGRVPKEGQADYEPTSPNAGCLKSHSAATVVSPSETVQPVRLTPSGVLICKKLQEDLDKHPKEYLTESIIPNLFVQDGHKLVYAKGAWGSLVTGHTIRDRNNGHNAMLQTALMRLGAGYECPLPADQAARDYAKWLFKNAKSGPWDNSGGTRIFLKGSPCDVVPIEQYAVNGVLNLVLEASDTTGAPVLCEEARQMAQIYADALPHLRQSGVEHFVFHYRAGMRDFAQLLQAQLKEKLEQLGLSIMVDAQPDT